MSKISDLLSDEESVKQLSELAQMLVSEDKTTDAAVNEANLPDIDIATVMNLTGLIGEASKQDKNTDLLLALRPHLGAEKQKRVDKAMKLLKILAIWNIIKDSGMLHDFI